LVLGNGVRIGLHPYLSRVIFTRQAAGNADERERLSRSRHEYSDASGLDEDDLHIAEGRKALSTMQARRDERRKTGGEEAARQAVIAKYESAGSDLLAFFHDRLKVHLRDEGIRHDIIDAVLAMPGNDDLVLVVK